MNRSMAAWINLVAITIVILSVSKTRADLPEGWQDLPPHEFVALVKRQRGSDDQTKRQLAEHAWIKFLSNAEFQATTEPRMLNLMLDAIRLDPVEQKLSAEQRAQVSAHL